MSYQVRYLPLAERIPDLSYAVEDEAGQIRVYCPSKQEAEVLQSTLNLLKAFRDRAHNAANSVMGCGVLLEQVRTELNLTNRAPEESTLAREIDIRLTVLKGHLEKIKQDLGR